VRSSSLLARVRALLRSTPPVHVISEREVSSLLRPHGQGVTGAQADAPLNQARPTTVADQGGACAELAFGDVAEDFTG
jgi:hypothetical protein